MPPGGDPSNDRQKIPGDTTDVEFDSGRGVPDTDNRVSQRSMDKSEAWGNRGRLMGGGGLGPLRRSGKRATPPTHSRPILPSHPGNRHVHLSEEARGTGIPRALAGRNLDLDAVPLPHRRNPEDRPSRIVVIGAPARR